MYSFILYEDKDTLIEYCETLNICTNIKKTVIK